MKFIPLASSSHGNAYLVEDGETRLLLECGVTWSKLKKLSGYYLSNISGCLITHEHGDHAKCFDKIINCGIPVYATNGTKNALNCSLIDTFLKDKNGQYQPLAIGSYYVLPFRTFHDAAEPVGFLIQSRADGDKLVFATDTVSLGYQFPGVGIMAVECNHGDHLVKRIAELPSGAAKHLKRASNTHMSLARCCGFLQKLDKSWLREVWLIHLSDAFSDEITFRQAAELAVGERVRVHIAPKEHCL